MRRDLAGEQSMFSGKAHDKNYPFLFEQQHSTADLAQFLCADFEAELLSNSEAQKRLIAELKNVPYLEYQWSYKPAAKNFEEIMWALLDIFDEFLFMGTLADVEVICEKKQDKEETRLGYISNDGKQIKMFFKEGYKLKSYIDTLIHEMAHSYLTIWACQLCNEYLEQEGPDGHGYAWHMIMLTLNQFYKIPGIASKMGKPHKFDWKSLGLVCASLRIVTPEPDQFVRQLLEQWGLENYAHDEAVIQRACYAWTYKAKRKFTNARKEGKEREEFGCYAGDEDDM